MFQIVCVGCGAFQGRNEDFGFIGNYAHCGDGDCRHKAYNMFEEDQLAGICHDDDPLILSFPTHFDRAA